MKKRLALLIALLIVALCLPALTESSIGIWKFDDLNGCLKTEGEMSGDVTVPDMVDGYYMTVIGNNCFSDQHGITSIAFPETIEVLQNAAISRMDGLASVALPEGLKVIAASNFSLCNALESVTVPASVRYISGSFYWCDNLREIRFLGVCPIFDNLVWCFSSLPEDYVIYVPDDQVDAYKAVLKETENAADHIQPSGQNAVLCEASTTEADFLFAPETQTITGYQGISSWVEIPASIGGIAVTGIADEAFLSNHDLYGLILPEGVESIGARAFMYAYNLQYLKFPSTLKRIGEEAFFNCPATVVEWSEGLEDIGAGAFMYMQTSILSLPSTVKTIGESAFESAWCQELYLGSSVESIGARAFARSSLNYMAFDLYQPIDIAEDAFVETYLTDLDLPWDSSFENRDAYAAIFSQQCPNCTVWINNPPSSVAEYPINSSDITTIDNGVWTAYHGDQPDLTIWTGYDGIDVTALGDGLFKGNQTIRSFYPHHCGWFTTIGAEAFADSSVEYVELFGSITTIGDGAFRNCTNITELTLPASLTSIGDGAFRNCTNITELTLPASLTSIGSGVLEGCTGLKKLIVECDPALLPADMADVLASTDEVYAAADATDEQVALLSALAGRAWNNPVTRKDEPLPELKVMSYEPLPGSDFWYDEEAKRLDRYEGYELNLILPREIDGIQLTLVGSNMMSRASYGDNDDVELPVRSVVIPENYTEIAWFAFQNCDALETVICYAPIENLEDNVFTNCTNLRQVVFVNGVHHLGRYIFNNCPNLETVYLGAYLGEISEYAFLNEDQTEAFSLDQCITDPALMPDVDALLAAVKSDPMPLPTPEPTPEPAQPVGDEGAPFFGVWNCAALEIGGDVYDPNLLDMAITLTMNPDGTAVLTDGEETEIAAWKVVDGMAVVEALQIALAAAEDGTLVAEEEGIKMVFLREGDAAPAPAITSEPDVGGQPAAPVEGGDAFIGTWTGVIMESEGESFHLADLGLVMTLTLHADGTAILDAFGEQDEAAWTVAGGVAMIDTMTMTLTDDGMLCMEDDESRIIFARGGESEISTEPVVTEAPASAGTDYQRLETKFIMTRMNDIPMSMMGGLEYSMTFHADGTLDFVMGGTPIAGLLWTEGTAQTEEGEKEAFVIDYFNTGTLLYVIWTDVGFEMDFLGSGIMYFEPEA